MTLLLAFASDTYAGTPETYGSLLVWDSIMPSLKTDFDNIKKEMDKYR